MIFIASFLLSTVFVSTCFSQDAPEKLIADVVLTSGEGGLTGQLTFESLGNGKTHITGKISGLKPGLHGVHIHYYDDISENCSNVGPHYDPHDEPHGVHVGDIANILADSNGIAIVDLTKSNIDLKGPHSIIEKSLGIDEEEDRFDHDDYKTIACGIIEYRHQYSHSPH